VGAPNALRQYGGRIAREPHRPNNQATGFAYDAFDRLATTTYPLGSTETLTYDADSSSSMIRNQVYSNDLSGVMLQFSYPGK
jgi:YD repeat-containing protein